MKSTSELIYKEALKINHIIIHCNI